MKYTGQFSNIKNKIYQVDIDVNDGNNGTSELIFSDDPFTIELNKNSVIYEPLKLSNATCSIIASDYNFNLYSATAQGSKLTLKDIDNNKITWIGYLTPNIYQMGFEQEFETIQIEAIDGLSTLDNYKYEQIYNDNRKILSFEELIIHIIKKCNCYSNIYVNQNNYLTDKTSGIDKIYNNLQLISETFYMGETKYIRNYFESTYPVTSQVDILINNWLHMTIPVGQKKTGIYLGDMTVILQKVITPAEDATYFYTPHNTDTFNADQTKIIDKLFVAEQNFYSTDNEAITYKEVLTQLLQFLNYTIIQDGDELFIVNYDYIRNGFDDYIKYSTSNNWLTYSTESCKLKNDYEVNADSFKSNGASVELDSVYNQISIKTSESKQSTLLPEMFKDDYLTNIGVTNASWTDLQIKAFGDQTYIFRYFKNSKYTNIYYTNDTDWTETTFGTVNYNTVANNIGSTFIRATNYKTTDGAPATLGLTDYLCLHRHLTEYPNSTKNVLKPVLKLNAGVIPQCSYLYDDYFLLINTSAYWDSRLNVAYIDDKVVLKNDDSFNESDIKIAAKLKIGDKYWNGTVWSLTDSTFNIQFDKKDNEHLFYKWFEIKNNVNYNSYINQSGQKIPILKSDKLLGEVEFYLYTPTNIISKYIVDSVWLKDLKIELIKPSVKKNDDSDTEFKNEINIDFVNEFSDISLKTCSNTNKGLSYSVVIDKPSVAVGYRNNEQICTKTLELNQMQEHNIIQAYVNQYSTPAKKLNLTLGNEFKPYSLLTVNQTEFINEKFIVDGMSIDVKNDTNLLNIVSKK